MVVLEETQLAETSSKKEDRRAEKKEKDFRRRFTPLIRRKPTALGVFCHVTFL